MRRIDTFIAILSVVMIVIAGCGGSGGGGGSPADELDTTPPTISNISPIDSSSDVGLDASIVVTFSEEMDVGSCTTNTTDTLCSGSIQISSDNFNSCFQISSSPANQTTANSTDVEGSISFTLSHTSSFEENTTYKIKVTNSVQDMAGNEMENDFVTADGFTTLLYPKVVSVTPTEGSTDIMPNANITITFNKAMDVSTMTSKVGALYGDCVDSSVQLYRKNYYSCAGMTANPNPDSDNKVFTLDPGFTLDFDFDHIIKVLKTVKDSSGHSMQIDFETLTGFRTSDYLTAQNIDVGDNHFCAKSFDDNTIKCWGSNNNGQIGDGGAIPGDLHLTPSTVVNISNASQIDTGYDFSCALLTDNTVQCWGMNSYGQLGNGSTTNQSAPVSVSGISNATKVAVGNNHACALLSDNTIKCWGYGNKGQLGNGSTADQSTPVAVSGISTATQISAGYSHTCSTLNDNSVQCWGENTYGQLGNGNTTDQSTPVAVSGPISSVKVSAGTWHTCAVDSTGNALKCWGRNSSGELGIGNTTDQLTPALVGTFGSGQVTDISAGQHFSCALDSGGDVYCWGGNTKGELGIGNLINQDTPTLTYEASAFNLSVSSIHAGLGDSACAIIDNSSPAFNNSVLCWGNYNPGSWSAGLGTNVQEGSMTPVRVFE